MNLFTSNWIHLQEITFQVNHINFRVNYIISSKLQPELIYLKLWQIYLTLSLEANNTQISSQESSPITKTKYVQAHSEGGQRS